MRPTDENQHGSTRPNLLSGGRRRYAEDDNLLARLERDSARQASGNRNRAAWYAAAASLILLLIVMVAWMAYENANTVQLIPVVQAPAGGNAIAGASRDEERSAAPALVPVLAPALPPAAAPPEQAPPLVLLQAHEIASGKPIATSRLAESVTAAAAPRKPVTRDVMPATPVAAAARAAPRMAPRSVAPARIRKPVPGTSPGDAQVDTDVALLSAIIIHDSSHADERAQLESTAACLRAADKRCAARPSAHP